MHAVSLGETMAALFSETPHSDGRPQEGDRYRYCIGGAESNVARGLVALGTDAAWISRVGDDPYGHGILAALAADGVNTSAVAIDPHRPTGLYLKEPRQGGGSTPHYYRRGSAASALDPELLTDPAVAALLRRASLLHLTGITPALSPGARLLVYELMLGPGRPAAPVTFDLNWRAQLWSDADAAAAVLHPFADAADILLLGADEAHTVFRTGQLDELRRIFRGPSTLVVKDDSRTAWSLHRGGGLARQSALHVDVVEPTGAGDAFAAGYLTGTLRGLPARQCLRLGHITAAGALTSPSDHGTPPEPELLDRLLTLSDTAWDQVRVTSDGWNLP